MERPQTLFTSTSQNFVQNIYENHHTDLILFMRGKFQNALEGEEILQIFYLKLMKKHQVILPQYEKLGLRYLFGILRNLCNDQLNTQKTKPKLLINDDPKLLEIAGSDYSSAIIYERYHDELQPLLTKLEYQLLMMRIQGYSHQDVASQLEISVTNASVMLHRIRKKIARYFER